MTSKRQALTRGLGLAVLLAMAGAAQSQGYPNKPVRIVVPFAPGGSIDVVFRLLVPALTAHLGQSVIIDNRPGGAATIGMNAVAKSPADGYTVGVANVSFSVNPYVLQTLPYDTVKDFAPVTLVATNQMILAVHPSVPASNMKDFLAYAKARPGQLNYASGGNVSSGHLASELFMYRAGIKMTHIPFKGGGESVASTLAGQTSIIFTSIPSVVQHIKGGKLVGLGVSSRARDPSLPEVPTISESAVPGYEFTDYMGVVAPAGTPPDAVSKLQQAFSKALADPEVRTRIAAVGAEPVGSSPEELGAFLRKDLATWQTVVKATGIHVN